MVPCFQTTGLKQVMGEQMMIFFFLLYKNMFGTAQRCLSLTILVTAHPSVHYNWPYARLLWILIIQLGPFPGNCQVILLAMFCHVTVSATIGTLLLRTFCLILLNFSCKKQLDLYLLIILFFIFMCFLCSYARNTNVCRARSLTVYCCLLFLVISSIHCIKKKTLLKINEIISATACHKNTVK